MSLAITNTSPRISRLVAWLQAQSSYWLAWVAFVMQMKVNAVNVTCKMMFFYLVCCYLNSFRVAVNGWGRALMSYFRMGSWAYIIFWNGVAKWKRLGTTALHGKPSPTQFVTNCSMQNPSGERWHKQSLPPFVTFPWLEEEMRKIRCIDYENY